MMSRSLSFLLFTLFTTTFSASLSLAAETEPSIFSSPWLYDWGLLGILPAVSFKSFALNAPLLNFIKWDERCDDGGLYTFALRGGVVSKPGPVIMDARGDLVWASDQFGMITDVKVQTYKGRQFLTFWTGKNDVSRTFGAGVYYMLDEHYDTYKILGAVGQGITGDMHEFRILNDTALMTIYHTIPFDLTSIGGPAEGWLTDSLFQKIDIETGALLFEWRASEHVPLTEMWRVTITDDEEGTSPRAGVDFFHINSIDMDEEGNYIVSARHTSTVYKISGQDGSVLWRIGGKNNSFADMSDGHATDFQWQHHARLHDISGSSIMLSLFDNGKSDQEGIRAFSDESRGMIIALELDAMTATLTHEYAHETMRILSDAQGSIQVLPETGHVLVGYGSAAGFSEFAQSGDLLCDVRLAPWIDWGRGWVSSYRVFKTTKWTAWPKYPPNVFLRPSEKLLYVSWNGATEVDRWVLQGANWEVVKEDGLYVDLDEIDKESFESAFEIADDMPEYLRVAALDNDGKVLAYSTMVSRTVGNAPPPGINVVLAVVGACLGVLLVALIAFRRRVIRAVRGCTSRFPVQLPLQQTKVWQWARLRRWMRTGRWDSEAAESERQDELQPLYAS